MQLKSMKKRLLAIGLAAVMLTGCGPTKVSAPKETPDGIHPSDYITEVSEDDKYKEWADAVGLFDKEHIHVIGFNEGTKDIWGTKCFGVSISGVDGENAKDGFAEVKAIIEAHNAFVEKNPDYFPEDMDIWISLEEPSQYTYMSFFADLGGKKLDDELGLPFDHKIKYLRYQCNSGTPDALDTGITMNLPVIEMSYNGLPLKMDYTDLNKVLDTFEGVESVCVSYSGENEFDYDTFIDKTLKKEPKASVYKLFFKETVYSTEKIH